LKLEWARDRQFDKNAAQSFLKKIKVLFDCNLIFKYKVLFL